MMNEISQSIAEMTPEHQQQMTEEMQTIKENLQQIQQMINHSSSTEGTHNEHISH